MTSKLTGKMTGNITIPVKSKLRKMTYYFREDQLQAIGKLSKKTGRDKSELARMALDFFIEQAARR